jgi:hypothetical protein
MGYKRRNAELNALAHRQPAYLLRNSNTSFASQTFEGIGSEDEVHEVHEYLFGQYVLLGKVISARKLHHKHFFSLEMDYGHKAYLDKLISTRRSVLKALENLERRTAELLYEKEKWFGWVRQVQDDEDQNREKEQKKIKLEAALFRRHWREMESRLAAAREREESKRQEAYLDEVWKERMAAGADSDASIEQDGAAWDPIEDVFEDDRGRYLDLIRHFLWMETPAAEKKEVTKADISAEAAGGPTSERDGKVAGNVEDAELQHDGEGPSSSQRKKPKKRGGKKKNKAPQPTDDASEAQLVDKALKLLNAAGLNHGTKVPKQEVEPNKGKIESRDDIRKRLKEGVEKDYSHVDGPMLVGTAQNPPELLKRTAPVKDEDITELLADITEIKTLLFCRQIMSHSALLPAALRANSIDEFLSDPSIADSDLRDLCLEVEQPSLQALRDACADFARGDEPDDVDDGQSDDDAVDDRSAAEYIRRLLRYDDLEDYRARALNTLLFRHATSGSDGPLEREPKDKKMKVRICGRSIWNYASQRSMARAGWLQFSIMAKDCTFPDAIALCRNWDEFFELNILALWQYFPASKWTGWSGNFLSEELTQLVCTKSFFFPSKARITNPN